MFFFQTFLCLWGGGGEYYCRKYVFLFFLLLLLNQKNQTHTFSHLCIKWLEINKKKWTFFSPNILSNSEINKKKYVFSPNFQYFFFFVLLFFSYLISCDVNCRISVHDRSENIFVAFLNGVVKAGELKIGAKNKRK